MEVFCLDRVIPVGKEVYLRKGSLALHQTRSFRDKANAVVPHSLLLCPGYPVARRNPR
jgi:hypothetical protein